MSLSRLTLGVKMPKNAVLNNIEHKSTKVITTRSSKFGDNIWCTMTFPFELRNVIGDFPVFFQKNTDTGEFYPVAVFGFTHGENLFLIGEEWDAAYIPVNVQRMPFLIGSANTADGGDAERVVNIDMEHPRVNEEEGQPLFDALGNSTPYMERVASILESMHHGVAANKNLAEKLLELELLEVLLWK